MRITPVRRQWLEAHGWRENTRLRVWIHDGTGMLTTDHELGLNRMDIEKIHEAKMALARQVRDNEDSAK